MGALGLAWGLFASGCRENSCRDSRIDMDMCAIGSALKSYRLDNGYYPSMEQGLAALVSRPKSGPTPKRWSRLMDELPLDPWRHEYGYRLLPGGEDFEIRSAGRDGIWETEDDLSSLVP